ncbi:MAG TPA: M4 family metallopeptidase [Pilimelia sp.]|nr:M4 family metallopeptidase [Pilimelia sp.]
MRSHHCYYIPPHIIDRLIRNANQLGLDAEAMQRTAVASQRLREQRRGVSFGSLAALTPPRPGKADRQIFDDQHQWEIGTTVVRGEGDPAVGDRPANVCYDGVGITRAFFKEVLNRDSIDNAGIAIQAHVNFGVDFDNAFWTGTELVFGNGSGVVFKDLTSDIDVIGHELAHGVTQYTAGLVYTDQAGALNESFSDIFGACVEQFASEQDAGEFNWLIGEDVMADQLYGEALRSMAHPGTAYDNAVLGKDPQPDSMAGYVPGGDPHLNSGIPNRAFYLAATDLGTFPAAKIWYAALQNLGPNSDFADAAKVCGEMARVLARDGQVARHAPQSVRAAFRAVGIS